jgi:hypothetical protein
MNINRQKYQKIRIYFVTITKCIGQ